MCCKEKNDYQELNLLLRSSLCTAVRFTKNNWKKGVFVQLTIVLLASKTIYSI